MSSLREIQRAFRTALLGGESVDALRGVAGDGLAPEARLAIYRHHVSATLTDVLKGVYPVVCRLLDERFFDYAADRFIAAHPPTSACLWEYGDALAAFLVTFEPCRDLPYLPDVARFEWAMSRALHADDDGTPDVAALRGGAPADIVTACLRFHPSLTLLDSPWPIDRIWRANQPDADPTARVDLGAGAARLAVWRREDDVVLRTLEASAYALRRALHAGRTLGDAAAEALAANSAADLTALVHDLFADDSIVGVTLTTPKEDPA